MGSPCFKPFSIYLWWTAVLGIRLFCLVYIKKPRDHGVADQINWREKLQWPLHRKRAEQGGVSFLKKIIAEGDLDEGREVIVRYETATLKWKGFESQMVIWTKICERV